MGTDEQREILEKANKLAELARECHIQRDYPTASNRYEEAADLYLSAKHFDQAGVLYGQAGRSWLMYEQEHVDLDEEELSEEFSRAADELVGIYSSTKFYVRNCYRRSRLAFQAGGLHFHARQAYIREMDAYRDGIGEIITRKKGRVKEWKALKRHWGWLSLMKWICEYGENPKRLGIWVFAVIIFFTIAYYPNPWGRGFIELDGVEWNRQSSSIGNVISNATTALHFSVITFATLGYGDIHPDNIGARFYTVIEVVLGYVTLGILVALVARRLTYT